MNNYLDTSFDFRSDSNGKDPDSYSQTLRRYHQILWSKTLPNGKELILNDDLINISDAGHFTFSSDSITHTFSRWKRYQDIISQIPKEEIDYFMYKGYTIGGMTIFPNNVVDGKMTINQYRGFNRKINDRIDLTLECIRLYYDGKVSPLYETFSLYDDFFKLFVDFKGYVDFFLFQDLVSDDYKSIKFLHPFESFDKNSLPKTKDEYLKYKSNTLEFIDKRNKRIENWVKSHL